jgi:hypothetical protein
MNQSFVARVRETVKKSLEPSDEIRVAMENAQDMIKPNNRHPKVAIAVGLKELDPEELAGAGARAIFEPLGNILSAKFVGVNKSFCDMFGFGRSDLPTSTFKIMQGPLTDTRHLQEVRAQRGSNIQSPSQLQPYHLAYDTCNIFPSFTATMDSPQASIHL